MFTAEQLSAALTFLISRGHITRGATLEEVLVNQKQRSLLVSCARQHAESAEVRLAKKCDHRTDHKLRALPPRDRE